jgi:uncharacterized membrane protein
MTTAAVPLLPGIRHDKNQAPPVRPRVWIILWLLALVTRLWAAFYLPNAEQDGYSDAITIARLSTALASGHFHLADLYGFWLPLFQFVAALPNVWINDPLLCGKVLSGLCGATSCILVFAIAQRLTTQIFLSYAAFTLVLLSPLHLLYSAACMTDIPFGCLLLASLFFVLEEKWMAAFICAALAGGVRGRRLGAHPSPAAASVYKEPTDFMVVDCPAGGAARLARH